MKKLLFSAAVLLYSVATLAQTPAATTQILDIPLEAGQPRAKYKPKPDAPDHRESRLAPATHGQAVRGVAHSPFLAGSRRGAAVSAVASGGRAHQGIRPARGPRSHGSARAASCHRQEGHAGKYGRRAGK
ncbi:hypothetical protein LGH70_09930 [Hymenobacter sp. BT635]|uniref:Uncharacterized protein n=1 Tax=Hymenobacter nitidus TaxID=2880929 RepID=A0ABS8ADC7_9BACT|nr:hypothetical protein [Hymenobacter nitidus]MCB2377901.1 hypothetical protein [Hymenobacter nitidus]